MHEGAMSGPMRTSHGSRFHGLAHLDPSLGAEHGADQLLILPMLAENHVFLLDADELLPLQ